jgi:hypothetical protein
MIPLSPLLFYVDLWRFRRDSSRCRFPTEMRVSHRTGSSQSIGNSLEGPRPPTLLQYLISNNLPCCRAQVGISLDQVPDLRGGHSPLLGSTCAWLNDGHLRRSILNQRKTSTSLLLIIFGMACRRQTLIDWFSRDRQNEPDC